MNGQEHTTTTNTPPPCHHWRLERDADGVAWLTLDRCDAAANSLGAAVLAELDGVLAELERDRPRGVVILSGKENGFVAGADIAEFTTISGYGDALALIRRGQGVMERLAALPCPTVAAIHGFCLGGGLELALACRYRVAADDPGTRLGLPEVKLGIHPGFGGTVRLPALVGHLTALEMMLSGRTVEGRSAQRLGLVDYAVPRRQLRRAARALALEPPAPHHPPLAARLPGAFPLRPLVALHLHRQVGAKAPAAHYPAPHALIDLWRGHAGSPAMLEREAESVARLIVTPQARQLVRVFFLSERLKGFGKQTPHRHRRVHVVGAGVMGGDIAAWCALRGLEVTLQDVSMERIAPAIKRAWSLFASRIRDPREQRAAMDRLRPDPEGNGVASADVVLEAIVEKLEAKRALYATLEPRMRPEAILATNTSSLPLEQLGAPLRRPQRLVGLHFFNPVAKMPLMEVVSGPDTDPACRALGCGFARALDRLPLPVKSAPGFLVNRILMPYLMEAVAMAAEGIDYPSIDRAARHFGMPMGPLELADTVGLDICLSVGEVLGQAFHRRVPLLLKEKVENGLLGRKTGEGFYKPGRGGKLLPTRSKGVEMTPEAITDRLILPMLNEAMGCLREGVVEDPDLLDAGVVFGTGFAPFRGGPMGYLASHSLVEMVERLKGLERLHGERFAPDPGWGNPDLRAAVERLGTTGS